MKKLYIFLFILMVQNFVIHAQTAPTWTRDMNAIPDTANVFPVRTLNDGNNNVYVLSTYVKNISPGVTANKIYLRKYDQSGNTIWTLIYDNGGTGSPRGFDMAIDIAGNCYIAGGLMAFSSFKPLLLKVTPGGSVQWQRDSTSAFNYEHYTQVIIQSNFLYLGSIAGVAKFSLNGTEQWSNSIIAQRIAVDHYGQMLVSASGPNNNTIFRYSASGILNFSDSTINAKRIAIATNNDFYLLSDLPNYNLVKYDSAGSFQWINNTLPPAPGFGDIGFDVLTDYNDDVVLTGINDSIYKFTPSGNLIWGKPMLGLDYYLISSQITFNNFIAIAGTINGFAGYDMGVALYDLNGNQSWMGLYSGNIGFQEYTVDMSIDVYGIYVIENNNMNTTLAKFELPFLAAIDYSLVCVDSIWYDPLDSNFVYISIFNGNMNHLNYPSVQVVNPANNDTIVNPTNFVNFFAQLGNTFQTYHDTITIPGITNFNNYTFLIREFFGDSTAVIGWCNTTGINETVKNNLTIFPNPVSDQLFIKSDKPFSKNYSSEVYNVTGEKVKSVELSPQQINGIDVSKLTSGLYVVMITDGNSVIPFKFIKQ